MHFISVGEPSGSTWKPLAIRSAIQKSIAPIWPQDWFNLDKHMNGGINIKKHRGGSLRATI